MIELTDEGRAIMESSISRWRRVRLAQSISHSPLAALPSVPGPHVNRPTGGGGGEGNGAPVCTHTFADTPDGGWHEPPIINSDLRLWCPGITRKGLLQWQCWPDQELEWTANESELPQPEFELLSAPLQ